MLDRLSDILAFTHVADSQSFTLAAQRLGISRSAVGKAVARLEDSLATRLLNRTTRSVSLTEDGRLFHEYAIRLVSEARDAEVAMAVRSKAPQGRLRLDLPVAFGRLHVMPILQRFLARWPELEADVSFSDDYTDLVAEGIDLAVRIGGPTDTRLIRQVLAPHRFITCASPAYLEQRGHPKTPDDMMGHDQIVFTHAGTATPWRFSTGGQHRDYPVQGALRLNNTEAIRDMALAGQGIAQLGAFLVGDDVRNGDLTEILEDFSEPASLICAVYPTRRNTPPKVRLFIDDLKKHLKRRFI